MKQGIVETLEIIQDMLWDLISEGIAKKKYKNDTSYSWDEIDKRLKGWKEGITGDLDNAFALITNTVDFFKGPNIYKEMEEEETRRAKEPKPKFSSKKDLPSLKESMQIIDTALGRERKQTKKKREKGTKKGK